MDRGFAQADRNFLTVRGTLDTLAVGQQRIADLLDTRNGDDPTDRG